MIAQAPRRAVLLSIRPRHAEKILDGSKTVELRRRAPALESGDLAILYASSPVCAIVGAFQVASLEVESPSSLWRRRAAETGIDHSAFRQYFIGTKWAAALVVERFWRAKREIRLDRLRAAWPDFHPPQSFRYLDVTSWSSHLRVRPSGDCKALAISLV